MQVVVVVVELEVETPAAQVVVVVVVAYQVMAQAVLRILAQAAAVETHSLALVDQELLSFAT
jgi:hypothetical protein